MTIRRSLYLLPLFVVSFATGCSKGEPPIVTQAEIDQIHSGMTFDEVKNIIGAEPTTSTVPVTPSPGQSSIYLWVNEDESSATIVFVDGKVASEDPVLAKNLP